MSDDTRPTMNASPSTERNTWRRLAPTIRSSASSRVRWPTVMENVFRMVKPPTNRAMKPKTSRAVLKKPKAWLMAPLASLMTVCEVTTSTPLGSTCAMSCWTTALLAPGVLTMLMLSNLPTSPRTFCAVETSNAASVAPARLFAVPKRVRPVMVKVRVGPCRRMRTDWPTLKSYFCAVPRSMATSRGPVGGRPWAIWSAEISWLGSNSTPNVGAPPVVTALPSCAMNCA